MSSIEPDFPASKTLVKARRRKAKVAPTCLSVLAWLLLAVSVLANSETAPNSDGVTQMRRGHFIADDLPSRGGYTYTLTSRLGAMLAELESIYGKRDLSYTILGIEFGADEAPQIWYPGNRQQVVIQLARNALFDEALALFQLAHEAVHLLAPSGGRRATILEEGLAATYAVDYVGRLFPHRKFSQMPSYAAAGKLVRELMRDDPGCVARLRRTRPSFATWEVHDFSASCPRVSPALASSLLGPFSR